MKKKFFRFSLTLAVAAGIFLSPFTVRPAAAEAAAKIPFTAYNIACSMQEGEIWVEDGVLHLRDRVLQSIVVSDSEYHAGTGQIVANANIDLATGYGTYHGTLEIYPAAKDGYWAGSWTIQISESGPNGIARLQGFGPDLQGFALKGSLTYLPPNILAGFADTTCGGNQPVAGTLSEGIILIP